MKGNKEIFEESTVVEMDDAKTIENKLNKVLEWKKGEFKFVLLSIVALVTLTILFFIISLFLNETGNKIASEVTIFAFSALFIHGISGIVTGKSRFSFIKGRLKALLFLVMLIILIINFSLISSTNSVLAKNYGNNVFAKLGVYSKIISRDKSSAQTSKDMESYNASFASVKYKNNRIYYNSGLEPALPLIETYLDDAISINDKTFPNVTASPLSIRFDFNKEIFGNRNPDMKDMEGVYNFDEKAAYIYISDCYKDVLSPGNKSADLKNTILHEYAHHIYFDFLKQNQLSQENIPAWFIEGIASYIGEEGGWIDPPQSLVDFDKLATEKQWENYCKETNGSVYAEGYYAVDELILLKGKNIIKEILLKTKYADFNTAFNDVVGFSVKDYQKSLQEDANNNWKNFNKMNHVFPTSDLHWDIRLECLESYIKSKPDNINALLDLSQLYEGNGELGKAKKTISTAVEKEPNNPLVNHRLSLIEKEITESKK